MCKIVMKLFGQRSEGKVLLTFQEAAEAIAEIKEAAIQYGYDVPVWYEWCGYNR